LVSLRLSQNLCNLCQKARSIVGHCVILSFVFIHIPGGSFIFNIFLGERPASDLAEHMGEPPQLAQAGISNLRMSSAFSSFGAIRGQTLFRHFWFLDWGHGNLSRVRQPWRRLGCSGALPVPMICVGMRADQWPDCSAARRPPLYGRHNREGLVKGGARFGAYP